MVSQQELSASPQRAIPRSKSRGNDLRHHLTSILILSGGIFAVIAAFLARSGFTGREHVIGIDLGTTYSVVAISQHNNVTIIPDRHHHTLIPSIVTFLPEGALLVGRQARAYRTKDPRHTIYNAKRFIGRSYNESIQAAEPYGFSIEPFRNESASEPESLPGPCFSLSVSGHPACVTPIEIGSLIIRHLHLMAHEFVKHNQLDRVVIAVPVDFKPAQRRATVQAYEKAGLKVARVLEEPTAAAIAYGLHQAPNVNFILVFDFGGGTLDVSLLFVRSGSISVVDTLGDNNLGGEDLDNLVSNHLTSQLEALLGMKLAEASSEVMETDSEKNEDPDQLPCTIAGIRRAAEILKRKLSFSDSAIASCIVQEPGGKLIPQDNRVEISMSRIEFEALCEPILERALIPVRQILRDNHMNPKSIDEVVLVGGSSRIPWIHTQLEELFGKQPRITIDPDVAVAFGAARTLD
uniref:Hsp70like protein putative n=1 Tax=Albugo laibachii Nc14 TaxID=890382 RepID=F0X063_9STRA|nr:hsp70like protein putative [Albugo laibachii Nc14]|eukprot:CCA27145.1 hsp70like protein putative [Albugo laibachii Nc14]